MSEEAKTFEPELPQDPEVGSLTARVVEAVRSVYDPEIPVNIYELGLVYKLKVDGEDKVDISMTLTSPTCPVAESLPGEVEQKIRGVEGVTDVQFELTWEPPWTPDMMSEAAKLQLGML